MRIAHVRGMAALVAASLTLVGCGAAAEPVNPTPSEVPRVVDSPQSGAQDFVVPSLDDEKWAAENKQVRETGLTPPAQVFRGECANLYTASALSEVVGVTMTPVFTSEVDSDLGRAIELYGGMRCQWSDADSTTTIHMVVVPDRVVNDYADANCYVNAAGDGSTCNMEFSGGWMRTSGLFSTPIADKWEAEAQWIALFDLFARSVSADNLALPPKPAVGAWAFPLDCGSLVGVADLSTVPGLGEGASGSRSEDSGFYPQAEVALWGGKNPGPCTITGESVEVQFVALGGARFLETEAAVRQGAQPLAVAGLDNVVVTPASDGRSRIDVFDGPNWLTFTVRFTKNAASLATALVAALDTTGAR